MKHHLTRMARPGTLLPILFLTFVATPARAGMTVYDLTDVARLRLEDISFFGFLLLLAACGVRLLWNYLARDFPRLPRLSFLKALSLTALLSLLMVLLLVMISGARELLAPGAWYRQASHYRPNDIGNLELRQQSIATLRDSLMDYARTHDGHFPPHDYVPGIPTKVWQSPDTADTQYVYLAGSTLTQSNALVVFEPPDFGDDRMVILASGKVQTMKTSEIHRLLGAKE